MRDMRPPPNMKGWPPAWLNWVILLVAFGFMWVPGRYWFILAAFIFANLAFQIYSLVQQGKELERKKRELEELFRSRGGHEHLRPVDKGESTPLGIHGPPDPKSEAP